MKKSLTIGLAASLLAATVSLAAAGTYRSGPVGFAHARSADEINTTLLVLGYDPASPAFRHGRYYVLHAYNQYGVKVRVVADVRLGDIVSIKPVFMPHYDAGPRIIRVPQAGNGQSQNGSDVSPVLVRGLVYPARKSGASSQK